MPKRQVGHSPHRAADRVWAIWRQHPMLRDRDVADRREPLLRLAASVVNQFPHEPIEARPRSYRKPNPGDLGSFLDGIKSGTAVEPRSIPHRFARGLVAIAGFRPATTGLGCR